MDFLGFSKFVNLQSQIVYHYSTGGALCKPGINAAVGDVLTHINRVRLTQEVAPAELLVGKGGAEVMLTFTVGDGPRRPAAEIMAGSGGELAARIGSMSLEKGGGGGGGGKNKNKKGGGGGGGGARDNNRAVREVAPTLVTKAVVMAAVRLYHQPPLPPLRRWCHGSLGNPLTFASARCTPSWTPGTVTWCAGGPRSWRAPGRGEWDICTCRTWSARGGARHVESS